MATLFRFAGVFFVIYTQEHPPAHVHVKSHQKRPDWEIRIYLGRREDGGEDNYGRSFGDVSIRAGNPKMSKIDEYVDYLAEHINEAWALWESINP
ncbi:hypothetical protein [Leptothoe sp. PORK10 BA2]|jgi:hypothetical protein|uniref:hypothetical protein n=1 Tax=Leptothoe sp. PORK10 BA2 TaxID=3110254 RepID=UPI002B1FB547|nr:hypothetical protein [Leptothoe sp. PORK10 BA2]MEA5464513.1 hypothetical protein [Leptothoe sp. PORK10 BA2]